MRNALISVSNKEGLDSLVFFLLKNNFNIYTTGGTYDFIISLIEGDNVFKTQIKPISDLTHFPEILGGRVNSLHPVIYGGLLADINNNNHIVDIDNHNIKLFTVVVVNLYPFQYNNTLENIDIGGVSLIRASAKNYSSVSILSNPNQYHTFIQNYDDISIESRKEWAYNGFMLTQEYDRLISQWIINDNKYKNKQMS